MKLKNRIPSDPIESLRDDISSIGRDLASIMSADDLAGSVGADADPPAKHFVKDATDRVKETASDMHHKLADAAARSDPWPPSRSRPWPGRSS